MKKLFAIVFLLLALLSVTTSLAVLLAGVFALRSQETIVAIESLFGSAIAAILFAVLARWLYQSGISRLKKAQHPDNAPPLD